MRGIGLRNASASLKEKNISYAHGKNVVGVCYLVPPVVVHRMSNAMFVIVIGISWV
jgi:hypothetical protein